MTVGDCDSGAIFKAGYSSESDSAVDDPLQIHGITRGGGVFFSRAAGGCARRVARRPATRVRIDRAPLLSADDIARIARLKFYAAPE